MTLLLRYMVLYALQFPCSFQYSGGSRISQRRGRQSQRGGGTYYLANFYQKLHENKEISGQMGGGRTSLAPPRDVRPPLDPPLR